MSQARALLSMLASGAQGGPGTLRKPRPARSGGKGQQGQTLWAPPRPCPADLVSEWVTRDLVHLSLFRCKEGRAPATHFLSSLESPDANERCPGSWCSLKNEHSQPQMSLCVHKHPLPTRLPSCGPVVDASLRPPHLQPPQGRRQSGRGGRSPEGARATPEAWLRQPAPGGPLWRGERLRSGEEGFERGLRAFLRPLGSLWQGLWPGKEKGLPGTRGGRPAAAERDSFGARYQGAVLRRECSRAPACRPDPTFTGSPPAV